MTRYVALLRGINVGTAKQIGMPDLKNLVAGLGYTDVKTHLRSGNVLLTADRTSADKLAAQLTVAIKEQFSMAVSVVVRTRDELAAVVAVNPLGEVATDPSRSVVAFLSGPPDAAGLAALLAVDVSPEQIVADGLELYLWCPDGQADGAATKELTKAKLKVTVTARNWRTVTKLLELADG
jgi:Uncharacterized protein conserved in bacteria